MNMNTKKLLFALIISMLTGSTFAKDNTGTNPINFTNDLRVYYNFSELNTQGDGKIGTTTLQYRTPFADGKWQFQLKVPYANREIDITGNGTDDIDDSGIGDISMRFVTVPILKMEKKFALAVGLELGFDTADNPNGSTTLGPQVFAVFFKPPGGGALVAPAYQHVFSIDGKDVNRSQLDLFYLYKYKDKFFNWAMINPQAVIDYENDNNTHMNIDFEAGKMLSETQSFYLRPGVGIGGDRLFDWDLEAGLKVVW